MAPFLTIAESELATAGSPQTLDIRRFLATTGAQFMQDIVRIAEFSENDADNKLAALGQTRATVVRREGDVAMVQIEVPGQGTETEPFVRVEGKWIPKEMADDWAEGMQEAREQTLQMGMFQVFGGMMELAQAMEAEHERP